jgi:nicotinic acid phosphoribosyltransferase
MAFTFQTLIATKAARVVQSAGGREVVEFGSGALRERQGWSFRPIQQNLDAVGWLRIA